MSFYLFPGIRYDSREPLPVDFEGFDDYTETEPQTNRGKRRPLMAASTFAAQQHCKPNPDQIRHHLLAPQSTTVQVDVVHDTAKFTVTHLFRNDSDIIENGTYQFPLPLEVIVTAFNLRIGNERVIRGQVDSKQKSRQHFEDAKRRGLVGGLFEQQTAEIFTVSVANIPINTDMRSKLSFACLLKDRAAVDQQVFYLTLPTFISPRYGELPRGLQLENQGCGSLSIEIDVLATESIQDIRSDTHSITWERRENQAEYQSWDDFVANLGNGENAATDPRAAKIWLSDGKTCLDRDFVITIATAISNESGAAQACLEAHPSFPNHQALMLSLPTNVFRTESPRLDREIVFVADRSGSMSDKMGRLKSAMMFFIKGIPESVFFNIWCYGSNSTSLWPMSKPLTGSTMQKAISYVDDEFEADMGGTEILPVIKKVRSSRNHSLGLIDVIVLTDGEVWRPEEILNFIREWRQASENTARVFALGIGRAVSHDLIQGIAIAGGGSSEIVTSDPHGVWEDRVVTLLRAAKTDHVRSVKAELKWRHGSLAPDHKQSPNDASIMNPFTRNRFYMLFDDEATDTSKLESIYLHIADTAGATHSVDLVPKRLVMPNDTIHLLAVRGLLEDLRKGDSWLHKTAAAYPLLIEEEAVKLGCKWSLVSEWTSMYAVESDMCSTGSPTNAASELLIDIVTPNLQPHLPRQSQNFLDTGRWTLVSNRTKLARHSVIHHCISDQVRSPQFPDPGVNYQYPPDQNGGTFIIQVQHPPQTPDSCTTSPDGSRSPDALDINPSPGHSDTNSPRSEPRPLCKRRGVTVSRNKLNTTEELTTTGPDSLIRKFLSFQRADGCIVMSDHGAVKGAIGVPFLKLAIELEAMLNSFDVAVTLAALALLEERLQDHQDLWFLMAVKAKGYVESRVSVCGQNLEELMRKARVGVKNIELFTAERLEVPPMELPVDLVLAPTTL